MAKFTITLNKKLYTMFLKNFKNELSYYNRSGVLYYMLTSYPFANIRKEQIKENDVFIEDFLKYLDRHQDKTRVTFTMQSSEMFALRKIEEQIEFFFECWNEEYDQENEKHINFFKTINFTSSAINYMMFHMLVMTGAIELQFKENIDGVGFNQQYDFSNGINNPEGIFDESRVYF